MIFPLCSEAVWGWMGAGVLFNLIVAGLLLNVHGGIFTHMSDPLLGGGMSQRLARRFSLMVTPPRSLDISFGGSRLVELHEVYRGCTPIYVSL